MGEKTDGLRKAFFAAVENAVDTRDPSEAVQDEFFFRREAGRRILKEAECDRLSPAEMAVRYSG